MVAKALLCFGANINAINCRRQTPLDLATIAWAAYERHKTVVNETVDAFHPPNPQWARQQCRLDSTSSWVIVDTQSQSNGSSRRRTPERETPEREIAVFTPPQSNGSSRTPEREMSVDRSMEASGVSKDSDDFRSFAESTMISLSEDTVEVRSKTMGAESVVVYDKGDEILELLYSCGAAQGKALKKTFNMKVRLKIS